MNGIIPSSNLRSLGVVLCTLCLQHGDLEMGAERYTREGLVLDDLANEDAYPASDEVEGEWEGICDEAASGVHTTPSPQATPKADGEEGEGIHQVEVTSEGVCDGL